MSSVADGHNRYDLHMERSFDFKRIRELKAGKDGQVYKADDPCLIDLHCDNLKEMGVPDRFNELNVAGKKMTVANIYMHKQC